MFMGSKQIFRYIFWVNNNLLVQRFTLLIVNIFIVVIILRLILQLFIRNIVHD